MLNFLWKKLFCLSSFRRKNKSLDNWINKEKFFQLLMIADLIRSKIFIALINRWENKRKSCKKFINKFSGLIKHFTRSWWTTLNRCKTIEIWLVLKSFLKRSNRFRMKVSGMQTRLIDDDEILMDNRSVETITKEILYQISCWNDGMNEIDLE